ncbi:stage II sporulation protein M [bacterium]|nr:stage II sporulation protein M [bacterium]
MNIRKFVQRRQEKWAEYEGIIKELDKSKTRFIQKQRIKQFSRLYKTVSSDLAYARTYYPASDVEDYLNSLVLRGHTHFYHPRFTAFRNVWVYIFNRFPAVFRDTRKMFYLSSVVFFGSGILAYFLTIMNEKWAYMVLGSGIIQNIKNGEMWTNAIGVMIPSSIASARILTNNIGVTFLVFAAGMLWGVGTFYILMINGMNLGTVIAMTTMYNMNGDLFNFIIAHGITEISMILVAGGAGFLLGKALINPGNLSRNDALKENGAKAATLILGGLPFLVICGYIEGYMSPGTLFPGWSKYLVGILLGAIFWGMLIIQPSPTEDYSEIKSSDIIKK